MRSTRKKIYRIDSLDYGKTWCEAYPTKLLNNCSGIDTLYRKNGILTVVYNPVLHNWGKRTSLIVSISEDNGQIFRESLVLEDKEGEISYPPITVERDSFHIIYTANRKTYKYCQIKYQ